MSEPTVPTRSTGLPDPHSEADFYDSVPTKRALAWLIDVIIVAIICSFVAVFSLFTLVLLLPLYLVVDFIYRTWTLSSESATWGMRMMSIEFRRPNGERFDGGTAFFHTLGYMISIVNFPLQMISIVTILLSEKKQSLTDFVLGTAAINRGAS